MARDRLDRRTSDGVCDAIFIVEHLIPPVGTSDRGTLSDVAVKVSGVGDRELCGVMQL